MVTSDGASVSFGDRSNWLRAEYYTYDGNSDYWNTPSRGNLAQIEVWSGANNNGRRVAARFGYDAWGNIVRERNGRSQRTDHVYDSVNGQTTRYVYGANGERLKLIENAGTANETVTLYLPMTEIRNYGQGSSEIVITYPHPDVRFVNDVPSYVHRDHLQSLRMITNQVGARGKRRVMLKSW